MLDPADWRPKAVLQRYPLNAVRDHPAWSRPSDSALPVTAPIRQIMVELLGAASNKLELGPLERYPHGTTIRNPCGVTSARSITTCRAVAPIQ